jgi:hypothetical protein
LNRFPRPGYHLRDRPRPDLKPYGSPDTPRAVRSTILFRRLMARDDFKHLRRLMADYLSEHESTLPPREESKVL